MNILLQTLSLLPNKTKLNYFKYSSSAVDKAELEKEESTSYYSSSEPATISVIRELREKGEKLDRIIVLCSPETHLEKKETKLLDISGQNITNTLTDITTLEFYESRLGEILKKECDSPEKRPTVAFEKIDDGNRLQRADSNTKIVVDIARNIQEWFREDANSKLYIDTQGGPRSDMFFLLSIVRLLKIHNIEPDRILLCDFFDKGPGAFQPVYDKKKEYSVFDLPSGIDEFINYAKAKQLKKFFTESVTTSNAFIRETIEIIENIANAVQICNMDEFRANLGKLKEKCDKKEDAHNELFEYVLEEIENDYNELLTSNGDTFLNVVNWCIRKEFYQQALTLLESDTANELAACGILDVENTINELENNDEEIIDAYIEGNHHNKEIWQTECDNQHENRIKYVLDYYIPNLIYHDKKTKSRKERFYKVFRNGLYLDYKRVPNKDATPIPYFKVDFNEAIGGKAPIIRTKDNVNISGDIYYKYITKIKPLRNSTNHGDNHISFSDYVSTIKDFVELLESVMRKS